MATRAITTGYWPDPPASVIAQRSPLAPETRSAFAQTNEYLEAQNAWEAHIAAGRITVEKPRPRARTYRIVTLCDSSGQS